MLTTDNVVIKKRQESTLAGDVFKHFDQLDFKSLSKTLQVVFAKIGQLHLCSIWSVDDTTIFF